MATIIKFVLATQLINFQIILVAGYVPQIPPIESLHLGRNYFRHRPYSSQIFDLSYFSRLRFQRYQSALSMANPPKSGGRPILSMDDFQKQVLLASDPIALKNSKTISKPTLVYFTAPWCGPCRLSIPIIKEIINQFQSKIDVVDVCTDDLPDVAENAGVVSIPTIQIYYEGELMDTIVGCVSSKVLASAVSKVLEDVGIKGAEEK